METKTIETNVYVTKDGQEFLNKAEAEKHEQTLENTRYFIVNHSPDLTEGRRFHATTVFTTAIKNQYMVAELVADYVYRTLGRRVAFVQGVSPVPNWTFREADAEEVQKLTAPRIGDYKGKVYRVELVYSKKSGEGLIDKKDKTT